MPAKAAASNALRRGKAALEVLRGMTVSASAARHHGSSSPTQIAPRTNARNQNPVPLPPSKPVSPGKIAATNSPTIKPAPQKTKDAAPRRRVGSQRTAPTHPRRNLEAPAERARSPIAASRKE